MASSDISDNLTNDPLATPDSTVTGSTDPTSSDAVPPLAVAVDQADADYAPGETVGITATDVEDGGSLTFLVAHHSAGADGILGTADDVLTYDLTATGTPWVVTDGGAGDLDGVVNGTIQTSWYVNADAANQAFTLTATDQADGRVATVNFTDAVNAPTYDLTFKTTVTINGALFSSSDVVTGAGTGLLDPFVRISASGNNTSEQGYNTDFNAFILDNTSKGGSQYVHSVNIADIPIQFINGVGYYRFDLDINESNVATSQNLSLDSLQIWQASAGDLHDYAPGATPSQGTGAFPAGDNASLIYNLDAGGDKFVGLNGELQPGSGNTTDMSLLVPISNFDPTKPYIYLYSGFGYQTGTYQGPGETAQSTWTADSGFEEWNRQIGQVIDGHKFNDLNADHVWQAGEPALSGWTIYLDINGNNSLDLGEPSTVTDANGYYHFTVTPGTYTIREVQQAGWSQDAPNNAQGEYTVTLAAGEESHNNDFGNFQLGSISGHKYEDADGSLATTGDETAVSGWTITLYNDANHNNTADAGEQVAQTTTDGSGFYQFTGLLPGDYLIKEESQSGWTNVSPVQIDQNNLTSGQNLTNQDFVNFEKFSISGTKYEDLTGDGKSGDDTAWSHDPVTIFIDDDNSGDLSAGDRTTTTDASGNWSIGGLTLADVGKNIYEVVPGGSEQTGVLVQTIDNPGSGGTDSGNDFTNFVAFSISGTKYEDLTGDGKSGDDTAWSHDPVTIFIDDDNSGDLSAGDRTTTTDASGNWSIGGLTLADVGKNIYEVVPGGSEQTGVLVQTIDNPGSGGTDSGNDFTNFVAFSISGTKYEDLTGDGKSGDDTAWSHDPVTIFIDDDNSGDLSAGDRTTTTDASGNWSIGGLTLADVGKNIYEVVPGGSEQTGVLVQTIDNPGSGGTDSGNDFTNFVAFSISGTKYEDLTGDGKSGDDTAWSHDPVTIFIDDDNSGDLSAGDRTTTTDASGNWSIGGLTLADVGKNIYEVVPGGSEQTGVLVQTIDNPGSGGTDSGNDFTNFVAFSISGTKYEDLSGDGKTADDIPWSHDPVTIYIDENGNHVFDPGVDLSTTTDASGNWSIGGLTLADVGKSIYEVVPTGSQQTGILVQTVDNPGSGGIDTGNDFTNFLPPPGQGLTPGFWKNHLDILTQELGEFHSGWTSNTSFETIFGFQNLSKIPGTPSIADALGAHGGGVNHLERSSAAAFLSAAVTAVPDGPGGKPELNFSFSAATSSNPAIIAILNQIDANHDHTLQPGEVTAAVRDVLNDTGAPTSNFGLTGQPGIEDIASAFDAMNNQTHPDASVFLI